MAAVMMDGQSITVGGRRVWLVSGTVEYARLTRGDWASRLRLATQAGLNCIETPVVWSLHEAREGQFEFSGDLDLRGFFEAVGKQNLFGIVRIGPSVGGGFDLGGIPPWLLKDKVRARTSETQFLHAYSKLIGKIAEQIRDLQVTNSRKQGPVVAVQLEHEWTCGNREEEQAYLTELARFVRESGIAVPIISANNLYAGIEGEISGWIGNEHLHAHVRQLRRIRPDHPAHIAHLPLGRAWCWGEKSEAALVPADAVRAVAQTLAAGGQFNLSPFAGGTNFGALGGRLAEGVDAFVTARSDRGAAVEESGKPGASFFALRRICMFANRFARVFASLDPSYQPAVLSTGGSAGNDGKGEETSVLECRGSAGGVVFVMSRAGGGSGPARVTLGDGSSLDVAIPTDGVTWIGVDIALNGRAMLDYSTLPVVTFFGSVLVCFGPEGATGHISINGSAFEVQVPKNDSPQIETHEGVTVVVCSEQLIDSAMFLKDRMALGVDVGASTESQLIARDGRASVTVIDDSGKSQDEKVAGAPARARASVAKVQWSRADLTPYTDGTSERFASIDRPQRMTELGVMRGYAWFRVKIKTTKARTVSSLLVRGGDRIHMFQEGKAEQVLGSGPDSAGFVTKLKLVKGENTLVFLTDLMGRSAECSAEDLCKGLTDQLWEAKAIRTPAPKLVEESPIAVTSVQMPVYGFDEHDMTDAKRLSWNVMHRKKTPLFLLIEPGESDLVVVVNDKVLRFVSGRTTAVLRFDEEALSRGKNSIQLAVCGDAERAAAEVKKRATLFEGVAAVSEGAEWSFAKWEVPGASHFEDATVPKGGGGSTTNVPVWWRGAFETADLSRAWSVDMSGMTKGQLFLNGRDVCRYWAGTPGRGTFHGQDRYRLPSDWLHEGKANTLLIFEEHGRAPSRVSIRGE